MPIEKECRCCHETASYYSNGNIRDRKMNFAPSKLEIFATTDSRLKVNKMNNRARCEMCSKLQRVSC